MLLQPTSPFRTDKHINAALQLYEPGVDMVVSVKETKSNPYFTLFEEDEDGFLRQSKKLSQDIVRRQDCPSVYEYNGAIYIINVSSLKTKKLTDFKKVIKYIMSSEESLDLENCSTIRKWRCIMNRGDSFFETLLDAGGI